jgi:Tfp pilus assembly protein PilF
LGDLEKAERDLKVACTLDPTGMSQAYLQLANVYLKRRDMKAAGAELREYLQANPSDPQGPAIKRLLASIGTDQTN